MANVTNNVLTTVLNPVISNQVCVTVAKVTFMVIVAIGHVPLHARFKEQQLEICVSKVTESVYMGA
jgi:hypothetical protein